MALSALVQTVSNAKRNNYSDCIVTLFAYIYNRLQPKATNRYDLSPGMFCSYFFYDCCQEHHQLSLGYSPSTKFQNERTTPNSFF